MRKRKINKYLFPFSTHGDHSTIDLLIVQRTMSECYAVKFAPIKPYARKADASIIVLLAIIADAPLASLSFTRSEDLIKRWRDHSGDYSTQPAGDILQARGELNHLVKGEPANLIKSWQKER